jgi:hypothetical protein
LNAQLQSQKSLTTNHGVTWHAQDVIHQQNMMEMSTFARKKTPHVQTTTTIKSFSPKQVRVG